MPSSELCPVECTPMVWSSRTMPRSIIGTHQVLWFSTPLRPVQNYAQFSTHLWPGPAEPSHAQSSARTWCCASVHTRAGFGAKPGSELCLIQCSPLVRSSRTIPRSIFSIHQVLCFSAHLCRVRYRSRFRLMPNSVYTYSPVEHNNAQFNFQ